MRNIDFALMSLMFRVRDLIRPPVVALKEAGVGPGMRVLDYGCGPGSFYLAAALIVGDRGMVYALDELPVAAVLSFSDHHMKDEEIAAAVTAGSMFRLAARGKRTFTFKSE